MQGQLGQVLTGAARRAAVLGSPIGHSLSPVLHRAAYAELGLAWNYDAVDVDADGLPGFLGRLDEEWAGLSLTMPLKEAVVPLLDEASELVVRIQAANTVLFRNGRRVGENTDVFGMTAAIGSSAEPPEAVTIIGAGATARTAVAAVAELGARRVHVIARRPDAAAALLAVAARYRIEASVGRWTAVDRLDPGLVISTVPGDAAASLAAMVPARPGTLLDVTYAPWPTALAAAWSDRGGTVIRGTEMLLWQAVRQVELMTLMTAPVAVMRQALLQAA